MVPTRPVPGRTPDAKDIAEKMTTLWRQRLGFSAEQLARQVVLTPACGLAGAAPAYVREVLTALREAGRRLSEV
jgi:hypothetical protein